MVARRKCLAIARCFEYRQRCWRLSAGFLLCLVVFIGVRLLFSVQSLRQLHGANHIENGRNYDGAKMLAWYVHNGSFVT